MAIVYRSTDLVTNGNAVTSSTGLVNGGTYILAAGANIVSTTGSGIYATGVDNILH